MVCPSAGSRCLVAQSTQTRVENGIIMADHGKDAERFTLAFALDGGWEIGT